MQHDIKSLRHLYDLVESQVRVLKSLVVELTSYGSLLLSVLLQKLTPDLCLILNRSIHEDVWNLDSLLRQLEEEIKAREHECHHLLSPQLQRILDQEALYRTAATLLGLTNPLHVVSVISPIHPDDARLFQILERGKRF